MTLTTLPEHLRPMVERAAWAINDDCLTDGDFAESVAFDAVLAFLNACLDGGVAREAGAFEYNMRPEYSKEWTAETIDLSDSMWAEKVFPALILNLGEAK